MSRLLLTIGLVLTFMGCYDRNDILDDFSVLSRKVGPDGGIIEFYEGGIPGENSFGYSNTEMVARLNIPEGALKEEVIIDIVYRQPDHEQLSARVWEFNPKNIEFQKPVELTYKYTSDTLSLDWFCYGKPYKIDGTDATSQGISVSRWNSRKNLSEVVCRIPGNQ